MSQPVPPRYPVALALVGRACVVIGGGAVARRKVHGLLEAGAEIIVICPQAESAITELAADDRLRLERRPYRHGDLAGAFLAVAATDDRAVNQAVAAEAAERGVLVTVCDDADASSATGMALLRRGGITVAVTTDGDSPSLAAMVRDLVAEVLTPVYAAALVLLAVERRSLGRRGATAAAWRAAVTPELLALVGAGQLDEARRLARAVLTHEVHPKT